jgi:hypothetical protein
MTIHRHLGFEAAQSSLWLGTPRSERGSHSSLRAIFGLSPNNWLPSQFDSSHGYRTDPWLSIRMQQCYQLLYKSKKHEYLKPAPRGSGIAAAMGAKCHRQPAPGCFSTIEPRAIQRREHVGIVVDDLAAAIEFFVELGLEP